MRSSDFDSSIVWFKKAVDKIIAQYEFILSRVDKNNLTAVMIALRSTRPAFGSMIHALDYMDRVLNKYDEDLKKLNNKEAIAQGKQKLTDQVVKMVLASLIVASKASEEQAVWSKDFTRRLPYGHPYNDLGLVATLERDLLYLLDYQTGFSTNRTIVDPRTQTRVDNPLFEDTRLAKVMSYIDAEDRKRIEFELSKKHQIIKRADGLKEQEGMVDGTPKLLWQKGIFKAASKEVGDKLDQLNHGKALKPVQSGSKITDDIKEKKVQKNPKRKSISEIKSSTKPKK